MYHMSHEINSFKRISFLDSNNVNLSNSASSQFNFNYVKIEQNFIVKKIIFIQIHRYYLSDTLK